MSVFSTKKFKTSRYKNKFSSFTIVPLTTEYYTYLFYYIFIYPFHSLLPPPPPPTPSYPLLPPHPLLPPPPSPISTHPGETFKMVLNRCNRKKAVVEKLSEQLKAHEADINAKMTAIETNNDSLAVSGLQS